MLAGRACTYVSGIQQMMKFQLDTLTITVTDDPSKPYVEVCEAADDDKQARLL